MAMSQNDYGIIRARRCLVCAKIAPSSKPPQPLPTTLTVETKTKTLAHKQYDVADHVMASNFGTPRATV